VNVTKQLRNRIARLRARLRAESGDRPSRARRGLGIALLAAACIGAISFDAWLATCGFAGCPSPAEIRAFHPSEGGRILDRNDRLIGRLAIVRRINVSIAAVPAHVRQAFIATEDRRFYEHDGIDWRGFFRAIARNTTSLGVREGFSTITMQVAHNTFLADRYHGRSLRRKLIEVRISRLLERELTKDQILEHYLNVIYLGNGVNGVEAASRDLFGKSVSKLTLSEGAMLAALPKAPSVYTPRRDPRRATTRRNLVLDLMARDAYVTPGQARVAAREPLRIAATEWRPAVADEASALDAVRAQVDSLFPDILKEGDITVHTTLDLSLQRSADRAVVRHIAAITRETEDSFGRVVEPAQGAYVGIDPANGDILALVPGRRTQRGGFNRVYSAHRQPGSAFKPFVYAAALAAGYSPATEVDDEPVEIAMGNGSQTWIPANYGDKYEGRVTFRKALMVSANAATVRVSRSVGEQKVIAAARANGIVSPLPAVPAIALGAAEVTPLELAIAYAPFTNGGMRVTPRLVRRVEAPDGTVLWAREIAPRVPAMDPRDAYELTSMLRGVVDYGTGRGVRAAGVSGPVAGKTGTTNSGTDVWFVGYTPSLVAAVWFGYDNPRPISYNAAGGRLAAPAWAEIYANGWREPRGSAWTVPDGMKPAVIDPQSGGLATEWCPTRQLEWFKPGSEPQEPCRAHTGPADQQIATDELQNALGKIGTGLGRMLRKIIRW
jgi:1A family penicillin-binding protein